MVECSGDICFFARLVVDSGEMIEVPPSPDAFVCDVASCALTVQDLTSFERAMGDVNVIDAVYDKVPKTCGLYLLSSIGAVPDELPDNFLGDDPNG